MRSTHTHTQMKITIFFECKKKLFFNIFFSKEIIFLCVCFWCVCVNCVCVFLVCVGSPWSSTFKKKKKVWRFFFSFFFLSLVWVCVLCVCCVCVCCLCVYISLFCNNKNAECVFVCVCVCVCNTVVSRLWMFNNEKKFD